jgi:D-glycero-alpha-D-manno-heptose-7-phosphate kinase
MLITRTPYRISLFGGGTDYNEWLTENSGSVIGFTTQLYSNIFLRQLSRIFDAKYRIRYYKRQECFSLGEIEHPIIKHCLSRSIEYNPSFEQTKLDIVHSGDLPARSGMGTSSCFTVGLIKALDAIQNRERPLIDLAHEAIYVEQVLNCETVGCQDQIFAAYGGINHISIKEKGSYEVTRLMPPREWLDQFTQSLRLVFTGLVRDSKVAAERTVDSINENKRFLNRIKSQADRCLDIFRSSSSPDELGEMLHDTWQQKKQISPVISNVYIDQLYDQLLRNGAIGGKLLGAGGGGFLLMYVPRANILKFDELTEYLNPLHVQIEWNGSTVYRIGT